MYLKEIKIRMSIGEAENLTMWIESLVSAAQFNPNSHSTVLFAEHFRFVLDKLISQCARSRKKGKDSINLSLKGVYWQSILNTFHSPNAIDFPALFNEIYGRYFHINNNNQ